MNDIIGTLCHIADSIRETGIGPHDQLYGYISTGDVTYITRRNNYREMLETDDKNKSNNFLKTKYHFGIYLIVLTITSDLFYAGGTLDLDIKIPHKKQFLLSLMGAYQIEQVFNK